MAATVWKNSMIFIPWRGFLQYFPSVKALRTEGANNYDIACILHQDHGKPGSFAIFPALEEIELGKNPLLTDESQRGPEAAAFRLCLCTRTKWSPGQRFFSP
ncbi:hypothetical protein V8E52_005727 [Russula decolorans]|jgi:hypothetical protein